ncbi:salicylate hydroxylase [Caldovatus sediminis]|uniref:Salicylate hydroxylase n=1 Tax=Caldovatus sediminis TaxID=2041189 RepID=A0A8J2Z8W7_9PROT|nr:3-hydroxybenzoate 6-monooxygenase [Caldovatus sediminis]GGG23419.1 salicylate hydroxylase [Caldovatus sediminis]
MSGDPVLVVGGGIGGLGAALALARAGQPVHLVEKARRFGEVGAGIQLGPNVFAMFDRLGVRAAVEETAVRPEALVMRCALRGHEIVRIPLGERFAARFGQPYAVTHRADLHAALLAACRAQPGIVLETGRAAAGFAQDADGVTLRLEGGAALRGRALVGADGLWSRIRAQVMGDGAPDVSGHIAYRAVLPMDRVPPGIARREVVLWAGPRIHLVHYPLRRGGLMNLVAVFHSDHYSEGWDQQGDPALLWRHFEGTRPEVRAMLRRIETWRYWVLCDREPRRGWTKGRVTLLGDAAHPMLQYLAQGAAMSLEDAVCLADQFRAHGGDAAAAFAAYEEARVLRTARVQLTARFYGEIYHAAGVKAELRDQMLGGGGEGAWDGMAWLYDRPRWPGAI